MPLAAAAAQLVASAVGAGHRDVDFAALILEQARRSGYDLAPENVEVDDGLETDRDAAAARPGPRRSRLRAARRLRPAAHATGSAARARRCEASDCGAFLLFDFYNIRYTTQTWIGGALGDKMTRYALLTARRRADAVGLRLRGTSPPAVLAVARAGELPGRACSGCAARSRPSAGLMESAVTRDQGAAHRRGRRRRTGRPSTSSSRRSCSRCSGRACTSSTRSS